MNAIMNVIFCHILRCHVWRVVAIGAVALAIPQLASASDSEIGTAFKLAMGPTSATAKRAGPPPASDNAVTTGCTPADGSCPKPHHRAKHRRKAPAARTK